MYTFVTASRAHASHLRMRWMSAGWCPLLAFLYLHGCHGFNWESLNLPENHMPYFFTNNPEIKMLCQEDDQCPFKMALTQDKCWGYENACPPQKRIMETNCSQSSKGWANSKEDQVQEFWRSADFGYVSARLEEMKPLCVPKTQEDSSLECAKYLRYCRAKNIYLDFRGVQFAQSEKFQENFLLEGKVGGHCKLKKSLLQKEGDHKSALQSWFAELEHYTSLGFRPLDSKNCDIIIDKPTMFMKLDAGVNMYHHFCDFINFYVSQHINNSFSTDIQLVRWDTSNTGYGDLFAETFRAFTDHDIIPLHDFQDRRVCVKDAIFPLLPRMRYGLFYNMPLIPGCQDTGLFRAFSEHLVHRLHIQQQGPLKGKIRITILERRTKYRNILNQEELVSALKTVGEYEVQLVTFKYREMPFLEQVKISHNSDIFIGMHGAGLTHMLFQPHWGAVIELFNCGDPACYLDLARLRGVQYFTWENDKKLIQEDEGHHPTLGAHQKFTNYGFDIEEFMRLVAKAADHVRSHPEYIAASSSTSRDTMKEEL